MLAGLSLAALLLLATPSAHTMGQHCKCSALLPAGLKVNCSFLSLVDLSRLPSDATELFIQDNRLTSVPPGLFDRLVGLKKVSLSGNPFHCDCRIQYLRNWLLRNRDVVSKAPTCASPSSVAQRAITDLSDDYFSSCGTANYAGGPFNATMCVMLCCLIVLLLWSLRLAKMSTITLYIDKRHSGFEAESLRSLKPKHRKLQSGISALSQNSDPHTCSEDLEKPLINMELLPQVLDVLHRKHNIKINVPEEPPRLLQRNSKNTRSEKES